MMVPFPLFFFLLLHYDLPCNTVSPSYAGGCGKLSPVYVTVDAQVPPRNLAFGTVRSS